MEAITLGLEAIARKEGLEDIPAQLKTEGHVVAFCSKTNSMCSVVSFSVSFSRSGNLVFFRTELGIAAVKYLQDVTRNAEVVHACVQLIAFQRCPTPK